MSKINRYKETMRKNMASAERDYATSTENQRGFCIGAVKQLWEVFQKKDITEQQFDQLIEVLSGFCKGTYKDFIADMVRQYKSGRPPIIIGY